MIERDWHITYREIQASLGIDVEAIHTILHDHLSIRKLCSRWIPHDLTEAQKQVRVKWSKEIQLRSVKFGLQHRYHVSGRNMDLFV